MIGNSNVGKTNLLSRFAWNKFQENHKITIAVDFATSSLVIDQKQVKVQVWDTAGQEQFRAVVSHYYRGAAGALVVYSITDRKSFEDVQKWLSEFHANTERGATVTMLVGNKSDLAEERRVTTDEGRRFAEENKLLFLETSAKTAENVAEAFTGLVTQVYRSLCMTDTARTSDKTTPAPKESTRKLDLEANAEQDSSRESRSKCCLK